MKRIQSFILIGIVILGSSYLSPSYAEELVYDQKTSTAPISEPDNEETDLAPNHRTVKGDCFISRDKTELFCNRGAIQIYAAEGCTWHQNGNTFTEKC